MNAKHFPDLELCKKLDAHSFPETYARMETSDWNRHKIWDIVIWEDTHWWWLICPSVMELLDEMPRNLQKMDWSVAKTHIKYTLGLHDTSEVYRIYYASYNKTLIYIQNRSLPNALAEMYLFLKENWYIWK